MAQRVLFDVASSRVLQWQDTALFGYPEPAPGQAFAAVHPDSWALDQLEAWMVRDGEIVPYIAPTLPLDRVKADRIAALSAACQAQIYAGFESSALGAPHHYPAKDRDQSNLAGSVVASLLPGLPSGWITPFWCMDAAGNWAFKPHTVAQIQRVGADGKAAIVAALERNAILAAQVMDPATDTAEKVAAIVW
jgi:hypothetical protein